ncbi:MAG: phage tail assembly chaperone [Rhizobiales bacterium]|nr:phage tail assembly chaperone [Hyphomicrobiales bacterium]
MSDEPARFPWPDLMRFGFGILKLSSAEFWAMTPREMAAAMRAHQPADRPALSRGGFDALMQRFPDKEEPK